MSAQNTPAMKQATDNTPLTGWPVIIVDSGSTSIVQDSILSNFGKLKAGRVQHEYYSSLLLIGFTVNMNLHLAYNIFSLHVYLSPFH